MKKFWMKKILIATLALCAAAAFMTACVSSGKDKDKSDTVSPSTEKSHAGDEASPLDLADIWQEANAAADARVLIIQEDGRFSLQLKDEVILRGTVKVEQEEHPDGSKTIWYSFYGDDGKLWESFPKSPDEHPQINLRSGQDGGLLFVRGEG